jgi:Bacterial Ig-like domain
MGNLRTSAVGFAAALALLPAGLTAQATAPLATSLTTIERYPVFFQGRQVSFVATPVRDRLGWRVPMGAPRQMVVVPKEGQPPQRALELRGTLLDIGRLEPDDSRLSLYGLGPVIQALYADRRPPRETLFALVGATWVNDEATDPPTIRSIVLHPETFEGRTVTLRGRFRAQNLFGDLPAWPKENEWDFVLKSADGVIWVTGKRPRGKGFDLDPGTRRSAGTWLQATGPVRVVDGLPRLEAREIAPTAPIEEPAAAPAAPAPPLPRAAVIFSAPVDGETGIDPDVVVRIQFSRDMDESSFDGQIRVAYAGGGVVPAFDVLYRPVNRSIEVRFKMPLAASTDVIVSLDEGILTSDGSPLTPATIRFRTKDGGSAVGRP